MGLGGVQRAGKTAKYLARMGWNVHVIASDPSDYPVQDDTLLNDLPDNVQRHIVKDPLLKGAEKSENFLVENRPSFLKRLVRIPDAKIFWARKAIEQAKKVVEENSIKYIFSTAPPPSVHKAALKIKKKYGLVWLADFRDPWFADNLKDISPIHALIRKRLESSIIKKADIISTVTPNHLDDIRYRYTSQSDKMHFIPNGFDPEDYDFETIGSNDKFIISHCGTLCSMESVIPLFHALEEIVEENPMIARSIEFHQIGAVHSEIYEALRRHFIKKLTFEFHGYMNHDEALRELGRANLIAVFAGLKDGPDGVIPGKLYEALAFDKPVMGIFEQRNPVYEICSGIEGVDLCSPREIERIRSVIMHQLEDFGNEPENKYSRMDQLDRFNRKKQAELMASLLEERG